ncbi:MAG: hypothetical protein ED559_06350 [Phycisphaera sp.]|nr:MAG: hypothetical protein ED559_06350 [Phycisphaera sp.]
MTSTATANEQVHCKVLLRVDLLNMGILLAAEDSDLQRPHQRTIHVKMTESSPKHGCHYGFTHLLSRNGFTTQSNPPKTSAKSRFGLRNELGNKTIFLRIKSVVLDNPLT